MKLKQLIPLLEPAFLISPSFLTEDFLEKECTGITSDSREVKNGSLFIALKGTTSDGHLYIGQAFQKGAVCVLGEVDLPEFSKSNLAYLPIQKTREYYGILNAVFYDFPSSKMKVIGVTGTSGKTTTAFLIESLLKAANLNPGLIGTVVTRWGGSSSPSSHTTPDAAILQKTLSEMQKSGVKAVVMEVSSHALEQKRVYGIDFDVGVFTNLSSEHMDYHQTMDQYFEAKKILFSGDLKSPFFKNHKKHFFAVNADDVYGEKLLAFLKKSSFSDDQILSYGRGSENKISMKNLESGFHGIHGTLLGAQIQSPLLGNFNCENIAAAIAAVSPFHFPTTVLEKGIHSCSKIPGRLEEVKPGNKKGIKVLVDYAHKPDALEKVLKVLKEITLKTGSQLITVVGCGGDRDKTKRPVMARLSCELSDLTVFTSDNPRTEDPLKILEDMKKGIPHGAHFLMEPDRKKAIQKAVEQAQSRDVVLIAGKGHEDYQIILDPQNPGKTLKIGFDDTQVAGLFFQ